MDTFLQTYIRAGLVLQRLEQDQNQSNKRWLTILNSSDEYGRYNYDVIQPRPYRKCRNNPMDEILFLVVRLKFSLGLCIHNVAIKGPLVFLFFISTKYMTNQIKVELSRL